MLLFLYGQDTYRSRERLHEMIKKFTTDRDPSGMNMSRFDCTNAKNVDAILEQITASPFLAEKRMVVLEQLLSGKQNDLRDILKEKISSGAIPESTVLVLWEPTDEFKIKDAKAFFEVLKKEKYVYSFDLLTGVQLTSWIDEQMKKNGSAIARDAAQYLALHVGNDMWRLHTLLEQLSAYVARRSGESQTSPQPLPTGQAGSPKGEGGVRLTDVQLFVDQKADDNIFTLVDAVVSGDAKRAYAMMREQYRTGEDAGYIFSMVLRQFRILLQLRDLFEREDGLTSDAIAGRTKLHPFVVKKTLPLIRRTTRVELERAYRSLLDIDRMVKTGQGDQGALMDVLVAKLAVR